VVAPGTVRAPAGIRIIHVVGQPGSGKTALAKHLARDLGLDRLDIADMPGHLVRPSGAWASLARRISRRSVVESAGSSDWEQGFWRADTITVRCDTPDDVRRGRLASRREASSEPRYVERMLRILAPRGPADHVWDGTAPLDGPHYAALLDALRPAMSPARAG
jgi:predicted kinase